MTTGGSSKGQLGADMAIILVILFVTAIALPFIYFALSSVNDDIQADVGFTNESKTSLQETTDAFASTFDGIFLLFLIGGWIFLLISTFFVDTHPIFFVLSIIIMIFIVVVTVILSNAYTDTMNDADIAAYEAEFPIMSWCMNNLVLIILAIGFTTIIALYSKNQL